MALVEDLNVVEVDAVEQSAKHGNLIPEGLYHAALTGCECKQTSTGKDIRKLTFTVIGGPFAGAEVSHDLFLPSSDQDPDKLKKSQVKLAYFRHRLGLTKKVRKGDKEVYDWVGDGRDFTDRAVAAAECVVDVIHEEEHWTGSKGEPRKMTKAKVSYMGVYTFALDAEKCKDVPRGKQGAAAAAVSQAAAAGAKAKDDYSDL